MPPLPRPASGAVWTQQERQGGRGREVAVARSSASGPREPGSHLDQPQRLRDYPVTSATGKQCSKDITMITRRSFLADTGMGFTGLALGAMLFKDGVARASDHPLPYGQPHHAPKAKSVIWIFSAGGVSHIESFDPKPELNRFTGRKVNETPHHSTVAEKYQRSNVGSMQVGSKRYGRSGLEVADWWPHIGSCADDIAVVRSLWVDDNCHGAQLTWHNGRHSREGGAHPTIGSWVSYGLGTLNQN